MYDYFTEHLVKRQKSIADFIVMFLSAFLGVLLTMFVFLTGIVAIPLIGQIASIIVAAMWWGIYFLITSRNLEFEYILTNGELDIDKVIGKRKRKRLLSVTAKEIEIITPAAEYTGNCDEIVDVSSRNGSGKEFVLVAVKDCKRIKVIFNPSEKMLKIFKVFCQRKVNWSETK